MRFRPVLKGGVSTRHLLFQYLACLFHSGGSVPHCKRLEFEFSAFMLLDAFAGSCIQCWSSFARITIDTCLLINYDIVYDTDL